MPRYVLFRSAPLALVTNPHAINANPARFAGRKLRDVPPAAKKLPEDEHPDLIDFYEVIPEGEVLIDDPHLRDAAKAGDGEILCTVTAKTRGEADKLFEAEAAKRASAAKANNAPAPDEAPTPPKLSKPTTAVTTAPTEVK